MERMKKSTVVWLVTGMSVLLALAIGLSVAAVLLQTMANTYLGKGKPFVEQIEGSEDWDTDYYSQSFRTQAESTANGERVTERLCEEGFVLLKNDGALPLEAARTKISLIGRGAVDPLYGGSGSGNVDVAKAATPYSGLKKAGFALDDVSYRYFENQSKNYSRCSIKMDDYDGSQWLIGEVAYTDRTGESKPFSVSSNGVAVYVISRAGGEGWDLSDDLKRDAAASSTFSQAIASGTGKAEYLTYEDGQHQLELSAYEKNWLAFCKRNYAKTIVVINSSNVMELGELERDDGINAVLWVGGPGSTGFNAMGSILSGKVNPSGRTADIYPADFTADPVFPNANKAVRYRDIGVGDVAKGNADRSEAYLMEYEEGIYVGYRYYETAAVTGTIDYRTAVVYPFGYGLSYTSFEKSAQWQETGDGVSVTVTVKNVGGMPGKEVVQLYYTPPYTEGGVEKSAVCLGDFGKTKELKPGESETLTLYVPRRRMASYDYRGIVLPGGGYVLEKGDYVLSLRENSHTVSSGEGMTYTSTVLNDVKYTENLSYESGDMITVQQAAKNRFNDVSAMFTDEKKDGYALNFSRRDFNGTFPTAPTEADTQAKQIVLTYEKEGETVQKSVADLLKIFDAKTDLRGNDATMPVTNRANGYVLSNLRGLSYDDPAWDELLDQLTDGDYANANKVLINGAYNTGAIESIGKPATQDFDGPQGFSSLMGSTGCCAYCSEVVVASTWNDELASDMGIAIGEESLTNGLAGWYGPALNVHRSPFAGRNFEYYSEDPLLSGRMACAVTEGAAEKGCYAYLKHFALNDSEVMRTTNLCVWANEQAIREIYLEPFRYVVENAEKKVKYISDSDGTVSERTMRACSALMSSFNRIGGTWAGGSPALMTDVLRGEWGFRGLVISDFNLYGYMDPDQGVRAGTDLQLTWDTMKQNFADPSDVATRQAVRRAYRNICFTVVNSNVMQGVAPGSIVRYGLAWWQIAVILFDVLSGVAIAVGVVFLVLGLRRKKS